MLGRRQQKYQKVHNDAAEAKDTFPTNDSLLPPRRMFSSTCLWKSFFTSILIGIYFAPSIGLTFYQRWLYKSFHFPLFTVFVHMLVKLLLAVIIRNLIALRFGKHKLNLTWKEYLIAIAPAGVFSGIDVGFSQWGLELIKISMYTMVKSTTIIFILAFAILFKLEKKSWSLFSIVLMISFGLSLVTYKADAFNLTGFVLVLIASMCSGLRWTCVQMLMQKSKLGMKSPIDMMYHMQGFMLLSVFPFMVIIEGAKLVEQYHLLLDAHEMSWLIYKVLIGAFIAFFMEFSEVLVVSYTSSLTLSIAGIFKELFMLFLAFLTGDKFSTINVIGLVFCIGGIVIHVVHKITIMQAQSRAYEFDASDDNCYDLGVSKSLLDEQEIEHMQITSESDEDQDSQEIFNILNRHDR